jgi:hypothetical protein
MFIDTLSLVNGFVNRFVSMIDSDSGFVFDMMTLPKQR